MAAAINMATGYFASNDTGANKYIIIISDGQPSLPGTSSNAAQVAGQAATGAKTAGIKIYTIAVQQNAT